MERQVTVLGPEHMEKWLASRPFAYETLRAYRHAVSDFLEGVRPGMDEWQERAVRWAVGLPVAEATKVLHLVASKLFLTWAVRNRLIEENPLEGVRILIADYNARHSLSKNEARKLLKTTEWKKDRRSLRDHMIITLMLHTGLRSAGVASIDLDDFETAGGTVIVKYLNKGHRGKDSFVVLSPAVVKVIEGYLKSRRPPASLGQKGPLLPSRRSKSGRLTVGMVRKAVKDRLARAGLGRFPVHSLRHTAATMALESGADIKSIQEMLGHKSLATTDRYIHSLNRLVKAAELGIDYGVGTEDGGEEDD